MKKSQEILNGIFLSDKAVFGITGMLAAIIFISIYGVHVLNPTYTDWLLRGGDLSQHYLGWAAYRKSSWHFPIGMIDTLSYPDRISVIFTDSIPCLAVFFKILSPVLPENFQYFGLWGIMCFVFQGMIAARILKNYSDSRILVIIGSLLFIYAPVMIWRMYAHTSLAGQWILLLGLESIFLKEKFLEAKRVYLRSAVIGILSASIHIYFVLMNGIILLSACLMDIFYEKRLKRSFYSMTLYLTSTFFTIGILGGFSSGVAAQADGLGVHSSNLNTLFNPQGWSCIYQDLPLYGSGQYEGFGYLGAGNILLLLTTFVILMGFISKKRVKKYIKTALPMLLACAMSVAVAISPVITLGDQKILEIRCPELIIHIWSIFRASGRIVWVAVYIVELAGCAVCFKLMNKRAALALICLCVYFQVYDIHEILDSKNETFNQTVEYRSVLESDFWDTAATDSEVKHIVFVQAPEHLYAFTDWALKNGKTVNRFYFARSKGESTQENLTRSLSELSSEDIFICKNPSNTLQCMAYDMDYYLIDNYIVGHKGAFDGYESLKISDFHAVWTFGNNQYMDEGNGEDTEDGRILYPDGLSYGPRWSIPQGNFEVEILGDGFSEKTEIIICSQGGSVYHEFQIVKKTEKDVVISMQLENNVNDIEIVIKNSSAAPIKLNNIKVEPQCDDSK
ncbi:MAG: DUF6311 domain-containing protein [Lachnospiraceae bacterium]|nr:DUF6311 domain-containing protein [Lachnospiraceae bacterium]